MHDEVVKLDIFDSNLKISLSLSLSKIYYLIVFLFLWYKNLSLVCLKNF